MAEPVHRMTLAIPASLKPRLDHAAERGRRSLNKQIITMLEEATASDDDKLPVPAGSAPAAGAATTA